MNPIPDRTRMIARRLIVSAALTGIKDPRQLFEKLSGKDVVFFDVETTGLDQHDRQITELAAIRVDGNNLSIKDKLHRKIKLTPRTKQQIADQASGKAELKKGEWSIEKILNVTGYQNLQLPEEDEIKVLEEFKQFCEKRNAYLVAHNAKFDMNMIGTRIGKIKNAGVNDTMMFARLFFIPSLTALAKNGDEEAEEVLEKMKTAKGKVSSGLESVGKSLGIDVSRAHSALADVETTVSVFKGIVDHFRNKPQSLETEEYEKGRQKAIVKERFFQQLNKKKKREKQREFRKRNR
jgi:DNA polymerase III alpha subunit (gram-positive type)